MGGTPGAKGGILNSVLGLVAIPQHCVGEAVPGRKQSHELVHERGPILRLICHKGNSHSN